MELKLRKRINNLSLLEHFNPGTDVGKLAGLGTDPFQTKIGANGSILFGAYNQNPILSFGGLSSTPGNTHGGITAAGATNLVSGGVQAIQSGLQIAGNNANANAAVRSVDELLLVAGTYDAQGSGYSYTKLNNIDEDAENRRMNQINTRTTLTNTAIGVGGGAALGVGAGLAFGASLGSSAGPIGAAAGAVVGGLAGVLTGVFGGKHRQHVLRKRIVAAQNLINRNNNYYQASAQSDYLAQQYDLNNTNTQDDAIYTAKHGKDLRLPILRR